MLYTSYATGFRSGGFFNRGSTDSELAPFASEEVASFEIGMRSNPTDNSQLNVTYFNADYSDKQDHGYVPTVMTQSVAKELLKIRSSGCDLFICS